MLAKILRSVRWAVVMYQTLRLVFSYIPEKERKQVKRLSVVVMLALVIFILLLTSGSVTRSTQSRVLDPGEATREQVEQTILDLKESMLRFNRAVIDMECATMRVRCLHFPDDQGCSEFLANYKMRCNIEQSQEGNQSQGR